MVCKINKISDASLFFDEYDVYSDFLETVIYENVTVTFRLLHYTIKAPKALK